uniref:Putative secreted protein n=1 Tax=Anopheles darlingi TaxID=43151 RepID=A0A2M4D6F4_ANODA
MIIVITQSEPLIRLTLVFLHLLDTLLLRNAEHLLQVGPADEQLAGKNPYLRTETSLFGSVFIFRLGDYYIRQ